MNIKTFEVDFDSVESCHALLVQLKSQLGHLRTFQKDFISKKERSRRIFSACQRILQVDIADLYSDLPLDSEKKYYVYAHLDTSKRIAIGKEARTSFAATLGMEYFPFYIGKGTGTRANDLDRNETHRKVRQRLKLFEQDAKVAMLYENISELEALCIESKLIDIFGLKPNGGLLCNLDEGVRHTERRKRYKSELQEINLLYKNSV